MIRWSPCTVTENSCGHVTDPSTLGFREGFHVPAARLNQSPVSCAPPPLPGDVHCHKYSCCGPVESLLSPIGSAFISSSYGSSVGPLTTVWPCPPCPP